MLAPYQVTVTPLQAEFLNAYIWKDENGKGLTLEEAYMKVKPDADPTYARQNGYFLLQALKAKGLIAMILESRGAGLPKVLDTLSKALDADNTTIERKDGETVVIEKVTNWNARLRAAEIILKLHGELVPAQININNTINNNQMSFTEAIEFERMQRELRDMKSKREISEAKFE